MFDSKKFIKNDSLDLAVEKRKIKKLLFNQAKNEFSDTNPFRLKYYTCVNECLHNSNLIGKVLDKCIVQCKFKLQKVEKYVEQTNQHAKVKVQRCIKAKRSWARQFDRDLATEEKGVWECLNRYHRRYLYYYPSIRDTQFT